MSSIKIVIFVTLIFLSNCFVMISSIEKTGVPEHIWFEAETAHTVTLPMKLEDATNASGGKMIKSLGLSHKAQGYAAYQVDIAREGSYQFWARCYWPGGCSNSFTVKFDNSKKLLFGNDNMLNAWHWVKGPAIFLSKGRHAVVIWNEEMNAQLDKVLLTLDNNYVPHDFGESSDYVATFEDRNAVHFLPHTTGRWHVQPDAEIPASSPWFNWQNIKDPVRLALKWENPDDPLVKLIQSRLLIEELQRMESTTVPTVSVRQALAAELNRILTTNELDRFFEDIEDEDFRRQLNEWKGSDRLIFSNRLLLERAYPKALGRNLAYYLSASGDRADEYALLNINVPEEFVFRCRVKLGKTSLPSRNVKLLFNFLDEQNYYYAQLEQNQAQFILVHEGDIKILAQTHEPDLWNNENYTHVTIVRHQQAIALKCNGRSILSAVDSTLRGGKIAVGSNVGDVYFDDIELVTKPVPTFENNFFEQYWDYMQNWCIIEGSWEKKRGFATKSLAGKRTSTNPALITVGEEYWQNYTVAVAFHPDGPGELGVCFNYQDTANYYLWKWLSTESQKSKQLIKVVQNRESILAEEPGGFAEQQWYKLAIRQQDGNIFIYLDDQLLCQCRDATFTDGKIGFWANAAQEMNFGYVRVQPTTNVVLDPVADYHYTFEQREQVALDYADWILGPHVHDLSYTTKELYDLNKGLFADAFIFHKRTFPVNVQVKVRITEDLPQSITEHIQLYGWMKGKPVLYDFQIDDTNFSLWKDGILLKKGNIYTPRLSFGMEHEPGLIKLSINERNIFNHQENDKLNQLTIGVGFSGIEAAQIKFSRISIN